MNFICCSENCRYQENGYCSLRNPAVVYVGNNDCWFFEEKNGPSEKSPEEP